MAYDTDEKVPSTTAIVRVSGIKEQVSVIFQGDIFAHRNNFSFTSREVGSLPIMMFCKEAPCLDLHCQVAAISSENEVLIEEILLPLSLVCYETPVQKAATFKFTLDSSKESVAFNQLFPEFVHNREQEVTSLGLQPYFSDDVVSIFTSAKTNRYRIQSDSTDFLYVVLSELMRRIRQHQPGVMINCSIPPLHLFLSALSKHIELERKHAENEAVVNQASLQMRHVETLLLNKLKSDKEPFASHINAIVNYSYGAMMSSLDSLIETGAQLNGRGNRSLRSLLNLMHIALELSGMRLPFNGRILDGSDQNLGERIMQLLLPEGEELHSMDSAEVTRRIVNYCESDGKLGRITEEPGEKEEEYRREDKATEDLEFVELKSGSLSANFFTLEDAK